jgi:Ca2+:H+ antiporter
VAAKTGDAAGGLLNATLGNLTELVIAVLVLLSCVIGPTAMDLQL